MHVKSYVWCLFLLIWGLAPCIMRAQSGEDLRAAQMLVAQQDYAEAIQRLEAVGPAARTPEGHYLLGRSYQALFRHDRAVDAFRQADTSRVVVLSDLAESLERLGMSEEAEAAYRSAYQKDSLNQRVAVNYARQLSERGRWPEVEAIYRNLVEADPQNAFLETQLGTAYVRLALPDSAIVHYELAHALNPRSVRTVLALTKVYYDMEFYLSAKRVVDRALDQRPRNPDLWRRRGEIALKEEEYRLAVEAFEHTIQYGDSTAKDLSKLGVSRYLSNDIEGAEEVLMRSYELDDQDVMNAFYLGMAKQQLQEYDAALEYLNHAADLIGEGLLADVQSRIGNTYDQMKQYPDAIKAYRLAINLDDGRTEALFHLAAVYDMYYADKKMAQEQYERFLSQVEEGQMPQMQTYARQRIQEIKEGEFFKNTPVPPPTELDTVVVAPDTTEGGER